MTFECATVDDAHLIGAWGRQPHVAPWWPEYAGTVDETASVLAERVAARHNTPWVVSVDGRRIGYVEAYLVAGDPLAGYYDHVPGDRGWHVLIGPSDLRGSGIPRLVVRALLGRLLTEPGCRRVVCDPDVRNERMLAFCRRLGLEPLARVRLPDRTAQLMSCLPGRFDELWPADRPALAGLGPRLTPDDADSAAERLPSDRPAGLTDGTA